MFVKTWSAAIAIVLAMAAGSVLAASLTPGDDDDPPKKIVPELGQADREAIIAAATQAISKHAKAPRKKEAPDDIDADFWGQAIAKLKPIRVRNDHINVAIVLFEKDGAEEGLYVSNPISSYAARVGDRFTLLKRMSGEKDKSFGTLYHYKLQAKPK